MKMGLMMARRIAKAIGFRSVRLRTFGDFASLECQIYAKQNHTPCSPRQILFGCVMLRQPDFSKREREN